MSASDVPISDGNTALCPNTFQPLDFEAPQPMTLSDITALVASFRKAAHAAIECGFNGIEIHGANGYIIDQFLKRSCNKRVDEYGGSVENRCRLCLEVLDAIIEVLRCSYFSCCCCCCRLHANIFNTMCFVHMRLQHGTLLQIYSDPLHTYETP